jgi:hypothetical protein
MEEAAIMLLQGRARMSPTRRLNFKVSNFIFALFLLLFYFILYIFVVHISKTRTIWTILTELDRDP